jgi:hypothetical protein
VVSLVYIPTNSIWGSFPPASSPAFVGVYFLNDDQSHCGDRLSHQALVIGRPWTWVNPVNIFLAGYRASRPPCPSTVCIHDYSWAGEPEAPGGWGKPLSNYIYFSWLLDLRWKRQLCEVPKGKCATWENACFSTLDGTVAKVWKPQKLFFHLEVLEG